MENEKIYNLDTRVDILKFVKNELPEDVKNNLVAKLLYNYCLKVARLSSITTPNSLCRNFEVGSFNTIINTEESAIIFKAIDENRNIAIKKEIESLDELFLTEII